MTITTSGHRPRANYHYLLMDGWMPPSAIWDCLRRCRRQTNEPENGLEKNTISSNRGRLRPRAPEATLWGYRNVDSCFKLKTQIIPGKNRP